MLSHYKAISLALRRYEAPKDAIDPLVKLLKQPGFTGHALVKPVVDSTLADRYQTVNEATANDMGLNQAFKELMVATMLYRCGDRDDMAERILQEYREGVDGHFSAYAESVLETSRCEKTR